MATGYVGKHTKSKPAKEGSRKNISVVTVGELRASFKSIEARLAKGMRVQITRRGEVVAEMQAPAPERGKTAVASDSKPDFEARLKRLWGQSPLDIDTTALISEGRERDRVS